MAGSAARCEFFVKPLRTMIELKFARKSSDANKIKNELATDFVDYGANPLVDHLICIIYDPKTVLKNSVAISTDLSGAKEGLKRVDVVVSPPRG